MNDMLYVVFTIISSICTGYTFYKISPIVLFVYEELPASKTVCFIAIWFYIKDLFYLRNISGKILGFIQLIISLNAFLFILFFQVIWWTINLLEIIFSYTGRIEKEDSLEEESNE